ncbi:stage II sporulation protein M [Kibdelosporangium philippinense]|uniref:Stage II sporulation protein M n=1 Tax=Kibdelosporangium philippinense TaxID=211113 RepID=A0ABS8ZHI8_9PSEU|nr:stage II sporulation protein M [Kibdelosporangium philippinense]MCE7007275.1 stage II sporulation protein M [Kibdelosporangium philippinense]
MDIDLFVAAHRADWDRLAELVRRGSSVRGAEADELVRLYQRTATHLSIVRTEMPDPGLIGHLSTLVARARSAITGTHSPAWREVAQFFTRRFPAALYLGWRWWVPTGLVFTGVSALIALWIAGNPDVQASIAAPEQIRDLTQPGGDFETYYSSNPAASFAARVWTNNAWVAAACLMLGVLLGLPVIYALWQNAVNVGVSGGLMMSVGRGDIFLGLITPHGLLELTAVFVAAGIGLKLGWTVIDPRGRTRPQALAEEGRPVVVVVLGLACVLAVSGVIEAFVTPSGLPTWARIGIGVVAELLSLAYVFTLGRRAAQAGETGDVDAKYAGDKLPTAA